MSKCISSTTVQIKTPIFGEACKQFLDAGIPARALLPIAPVDAKISDVGDLEEKVLGKAPGRYNRKKGDWRGLGGGYVRNGVPAAEQADIQAWPTPNVGILGHFMPGIDSDACNDDARRLVEAALIRTFGRDADIAERIRGKGPRRLYAFKAASLNDPERVVRTRHISYRLKGEDERHPLHKIDVIGTGAQYLIAGTHPSGDLYGWADDWRLTDLFQAKSLQAVENADVARFIEDFEDLLREAGGEITRASGGRAPGQERDYSDQDPTLPVKSILDGLQEIPNNEDNFPHRDDFVVVLSAIRAALGAEADDNYEHVASWACEDPEWCSDEYFEKVWNSLDRGVRVDRNALDRIFKRKGVFASAREEFPNDAREVTQGVRKRKAEVRAKEIDLLQHIAANYVFGHVNTRTDNGTLRMRSVWDPDREWKALDWWQFRCVEHNRALLLSIQEGGRYPSTEVGMWNFANDMDQRYPGSFYTGETRHPNYDRGEIVEYQNPSGAPTREINMRFLSPVIRFGRNPPEDPKQSREDLKLLLDFVGRIFGKFTDYELDTLAYMARTGKRPGHMLFLSGEMGVGKSIYAHMLISMFDGIGKDMGGQIDGTKMTNESARRFALARVEGCRIISVKELPEGSTATNMAAVTSSLKQLVDPGPDGDYFQVEAKGKDSRSVLNFARVITTSNYNNSLQIEKNDRRIFFIRCGIDLENKPDGDYYADLTDITGNPERLATLWRFLLDRDVSGYQVAKAPPVSREKLEAEITGMTDPWERHMAAAFETLRAARREFFDLREFAGLMTAMAENEHANSNGAIDDRRDYNFGDNPAAAKRLVREAVKIKEIRSNGKSLGNVYGFRTARPNIDRLESAGSKAVLDALHQDREKPLSRDHVFPLFVGPVTPTSRR